MKKRISSFLTAFLMILSTITYFPTITASALSNEETIYEFLKNECGLNTAAACGVLANIEKESNFNPDLQEAGYSWSGGAGYGICQWTNSPRTNSSGRRTDLVNWCGSKGYNYRSLDGQLHFLKHELETSYTGVYNHLKSVSNNGDGAYSAGYKWCYSFEVPNGYDSGVSETRGNLARSKYWPKYSNQTRIDTVVDNSYIKNLSCTAPSKLNTYDAYGNRESNRWVDAGDSCIAIEAYTSGYWKIDYPAGSERRIAYMKLSEWNPFANIILPGTVDTKYSTNVSCTAPSKLNTYDAYGNRESNRWVDAGDSCTAIEAYTNGYWKIDYPASGSRRIAYMKFSEWNPFTNALIVDTRYNTNVSCTAPAQIHTYDANGNQESNRWVDAGDSCIAIEAYTNGFWKIDYPAGSTRRIAYMKLSEWNPFEVHTHSYTSRVTKEATCTVSGVRTYSCSCGDNYTETIPATGHKYTLKTVAPTENEQGYDKHTCSVCGEFYIDNIVPPVPVVEIPTVSYDPGDGSVKLTWTAVSGAEKYAVCGSVNGKWHKLAEGKGTSYTIKNLKAGTNYKVAVVAMVGGKLKQDFSNAITVTPNAAIVSKYPKVTSEVSGKQFRLKWTPVANAEKYGIAVYLNNKWKVQAQLNGNVTTFTSPKISKGTYTMVVCAKVNGEWDISNINSRAFKVEIPTETIDTNKIKYTKHKYGTSELGRDLEYYSFEPKGYSRTVLLNFAIHGFEDEYSADAQVLVDTANQLIDYYNNNFDKLKNTKLIIIPCANPDGLLDGNTNNGFGRCNAKGIDLNRDFDANYRAYSSARNYTQSPFSASESRALRDLVLSAKPEITIDFHGWENCTIGNYNIAQVFLEEMGLAHNVDFGTTNASGYFSNWAYQQGSAGLLVEFTNSSSVSLAKLENAINRLLAGEYNKLEKDERFANFERLNSFTLSTERVTTYKFINEPFSSASYIDGMVDNCVILEVYKNGWLKVQYPITNGNKVAYARLWNFTGIDTMKSTFERLSIANNMTVYKRRDLTENYGSVYTTDEAYIVNEEDNAYQIIYELDDGGWKMGWISK